MARNEIHNLQLKNRLLSSLEKLGTLRYANGTYELRDAGQGALAIEIREV